MTAILHPPAALHHLDTDLRTEDQTIGFGVTHLHPNHKPDVSEMIDKGLDRFGDVSGTSMGHRQNLEAKFLPISRDRPVQILSI